jgi:hypothetical protein
MNLWPTFSGQITLLTIVTSVKQAFINPFFGQMAFGQMTFGQLSLGQKAFGQIFSVKLFFCKINQIPHFFSKNQFKKPRSSIFELF